MSNVKDCELTFVLLFVTDDSVCRFFRDSPYYRPRGVRISKSSDPRCSWMTADNLEPFVRNAEIAGRIFKYELDQLDLWITILRPPNEILGEYLQKPPHSALVEHAIGFMNVDRDTLNCDRKTLRRTRQTTSFATARLHCRRCLRWIADRTSSSRSQCIHRTRLACHRQLESAEMPLTLSDP